MAQDELTLVGTSTRYTSFKFEVLDKGLNYAGDLHPDANPVPQIENNINRTIKRTLTNVRLLPSDVAAVDPLTDRVRVSAILQGVTYPLGVFMWVTDPGTLYSYGIIGDNGFVDLTGILDQPLGRPVGYTAGQSTDNAIASLAIEVGISSFNLASTGHTLGKPLSWGPEDSRMSVMSQLANASGCYSPFFNNAGLLTTIKPPALDVSQYEYPLNENSRVVNGTLVISNDRLSSPNRWLATGTGATEAPVWATYTVPASAPHSYENRGFYITRTIQGQSFASTDDAYQAARSAALSDDATYEWAEFDAIPDFRHDTFDIVSLDGVLYREQGWRIDLDHKAAMHHSLRKHYE